MSIIDCFEKDGSLFFLGKKIWTLELLEKLRKVFIESPDEEPRTFMEKFKDQLAVAKAPDIYRLAAEMMYTYFLFLSNIKKEYHDGSRTQERGKVKKKTGPPCIC